MTNENHKRGELRVLDLEDAKDKNAQTTSVGVLCRINSTGKIGRRPMGPAPLSGPKTTVCDICLLVK